MTRRRDILVAWADTRLAMRMSADALARRRRHLWARMQPTLASTPALAAYAGRALSDLPVTDPVAMRADPAAWNSAGIAAGEACAAAEDAEQGGTGILRDGVTAGLSTGTNGSRGIFIVSPRERARYVGQSIARLLPFAAPFLGARIALMLRADNALYRDVGRGRFAFLYLPLGMDAGSMAEALRRFSPTILIAPPRELAALATAGARLSSLHRIFWGSEPMGNLERDWIGHRLGHRPDPIYQATEGFIAAACPLGALHLNDDALEIELEAVAGVGMCRPIVTDLRRHIQPMVRVRLDDLVRATGIVCPCGFAGRVIAPIGGRVRDIWHAKAGPIAPDAIDARFEAAVGPDALWRVRGSRRRIVIETTEPRHAGPLHQAATPLIEDAEIHVRIVAGMGTAPKRRRVTWSPES